MSLENKDIVPATTEVAGAQKREIEEKKPVAESDVLLAILPNNLLYGVKTASGQTKFKLGPR